MYLYKNYLTKTKTFLLNVNNKTFLKNKNP